MANNDMARMVWKIVLMDAQMTCPVFCSFKMDPLHAPHATWKYACMQNGVSWQLHCKGKFQMDPGLGAIVSNPISPSIHPQHISVCLPL